MIRYRPEIDGLRAVAIVTVVAAHVGIPGCGGGFVGVDIFLVISGYLITSLLVSEAEVSGQISLWNFYARRTRRLLPALLTVVLVTLALGGALLGRLNGEVQGLAKSAIASLLLNSNHYFLVTTGSYFDQRSEFLPLLHIWSLSLEEQFYLVWPGCLASLIDRSCLKQFRRRVFGTLIAVLLGSFGANILAMHFSASSAFYLMPLRAWELAAGALLAFLPAPRPGRAWDTLANLLGASGLALIGAAVWQFDSTTPFPGVAAILPVGGTVLTIVSCSMCPRTLAQRLLAARAMVLLGLVSYSWYLWHWPLLAISRAYRLGMPSLIADLVLGGLVALALAAATYYWIENPLRRGPVVKRLSDFKTVWAGVFASLILVCCAAATGAWAKYSPPSEREAYFSQAKVDEPPLREICNNTLGQTAALTPMQDCVLPSGSREVEVVLWGDSMADHWMPAFGAAVEIRRSSLRQLTRDSCPPLVGVLIRHEDPLQPGRCLEFQKSAITEIGRLRREAGLKFVVLSALWAALPPSEVESSLAETLDLLRSAGVRSAVLDSTPQFKWSVPECLLLRGLSGCDLSRREFEVARAPIRRAISLSVAGRSDAAVFDPAEFLCDKAICPAMGESTVRYRDAGHLTASGAGEMVDFALKVLDESQKLRLED
ncbi:MAG: acyltransferase family protein [Thermoanaerobaculia bacterium]